MTTLLTLWRDEAGYLTSAELILIATIAVLAMIVGLSEVGLAVNQELVYVAGAYGTVNQGYRYAGLTGYSGNSTTTGSQSSVDFCATSNSFTTTGSTLQGSASGLGSF